MVQCTIIIVNYNTYEVTSHCLESIFEHLDRSRYAVVVVDNHSSDGSPEKLKHHFAQCKIVAEPENRGYGGALNRGLKACTSEYVLFLNSDTLMTDASLDDAISYMSENKDVAACGALNLNPDKSPGFSFGDFPFIWTILCDTLLHPIVGKWMPSYHRRLAKIPSQLSRSQEVDFPIGAFLLVRTEDARRLQGFDENFFLYFEETDFIYRLRSAGKILYFPNTKIIHLGGVSTQSHSVITSPYFFFSWGYFLSKHRGACYALFCKYLLLACYILHYCISRLKCAPNGPAQRKRIRNLYNAWTQKPRSFSRPNQ